MMFVLTASLDEDNEGVGSAYKHFQLYYIGCCLVQMRSESSDKRQARF